MKELRKFFSIIFTRRFQNAFLVAFLIFSSAILFSALSGGDSFELFKKAVQDNIIFGGLVFIFLEMISIIIAPITTMFLIPVAADIFGPLITALLSIIGWTSGSAIAFLLARRFGRPVLEKIVDPKKLERYRNHISQDAEFLTVIVLRVMLPVDVLSYAIGLFTVMRFKKYILATIIGITPFSFIYSFGGEAFIKGNYQQLFYISAGAVIFFLFVFAVFGKSRRKRIKK